MALQIPSAKPPVVLVSPFSTRGTRPPSRIRCVRTPGGMRPCWAAVEAEIDTHLAASIPTAPPPLVREPFLRLVSSSPRTMAPVLCVLTCELVGGCRELALGAACALRLVHSTFHAHRPLMGLPDPAAGRGRAGPEDTPMRDGVRLLAADGLLPLAYQLVAELGAAGQPGRVLQVLVEIADATGLQGVAEGLYEEIQNHEINGGRGGTPDAEWLQRVCRKREGRLYACAAACGAILGGAGAEETEKLRRCGLYVGTLHGFLYGGVVGSSEVGRAERAAVAGALRSLALSELEGFQGHKKDAIVDLVDVRL